MVYCGLLQCDWFNTPGQNASVEVGIGSNLSYPIQEGGGGTGSSNTLGLFMLQKHYYRWAAEQSPCFLNRSFPSYFVLLCQNESSWPTIYIQVYFHAIQTRIARIIVFETEAQRKSEMTYLQ